MSDIKPWFRDDLTRTLASIYFASKANPTPSPSPSMQDGDGNYQRGFAAALASVALAVGVNPESFLSPEDLQRLRGVR